MSSNGVPLQEISDTMGHKSTHVTETVYRHLMVPAIRAGASVTPSSAMAQKSEAAQQMYPLRRSRPISHWIDKKEARRPL